MKKGLGSISGSRGWLLKQGMTFDEYSKQFQASLIKNKTTGGDYHPRITGKPSTEHAGSAVAQW